jgi:hypothetical protein
MIGCQSTSEPSDQHSPRKCSQPLLVVRNTMYWCWVKAGRWALGNTIYTSFAPQNSTFKTNKSSKRKMCGTLKHRTSLSAFVACLMQCLYEQSILPPAKTSWHQHSGEHCLFLVTYALDPKERILYASRISERTVTVWFFLPCK